MVCSKFYYSIWVVQFFVKPQWKLLKNKFYFLKRNFFKLKNLHLNSKQKNKNILDQNLRSLSTFFLIFKFSFFYKEFYLRLFGVFYWFLFRTFFFHFVLFVLTCRPLSYFCHSKHFFSSKHFFIFQLSQLLFVQAIEGLNWKENNKSSSFCGKNPHLILTCKIAN